MKKTFFLIIACLTTLNMKATPDVGSILFMNGEWWNIMGRPITLLPVYNDFLDILPADRSWSTANYLGYISYWSIKDNALQLDSVQVCAHEFHGLHTFTIDDINAMLEARFSRHRIDPTQISTNLRIIRGECIKYVHAGYQSVYSEETYLTICDGIVTGRKDFHNYVVDGLNVQEAYAAFLKKFDWSQFPELNNRRSVFKLNDWKIDNNGNTLDLNIVLLSSPYTDEEQKAKLISVIKATLLQIKPIMMYNINGIYEPCLKNYIFPLRPRTR